MRQSIDRPVRGVDYVYLVRGQDGLVKIGYSFNPVARSRQLRGELLHVIGTTNAIWAERELHRRYAAQRVKGEWFALTDADVRALRRIAVLNPGIPLRQEGPQWYGPALRHTRRSYGWKQNELAALTGCSAGRIALWERSENAWRPYPDELEKIAQAFGLAPTFFLLPREQHAVEGRIRETPIQLRDAA